MSNSSMSYSPITPRGPMPSLVSIEDHDCGDPSISYTYSSTNVHESTEISETLSSSDEEVTTLPTGSASACDDLDVCGDIEASSEESSLNKEINHDSISFFLDTECGEPLPSQHLKVDFTTINGVDDTEFLMKKCEDFWKLVNGDKKLQELKVLPEKIVDVVPEKSESEIHHSIIQDSPVSEQGDHILANHGALDIIDRKGRMVDDCFMNQMQTRFCESGSGDYFVDPSQIKPGVLRNWKILPPRTSRPRARGREDLAKLCSELELWDLKHPKSMTPPNHGPPNTYAVLKRN